MPRLVDPVVVRARHGFDLCRREVEMSGRAASADPTAGGASGVADRQHLPLLEGVAVDAADARLVEGRARAEPGLGCDPARDRHIGARADAGAAMARVWPGLDRDALPSRIGSPSRSGCMSAPVTAITASRSKSSVGSEELAFESAGARPRCRPRDWPAGTTSCRRDLIRESPDCKADAAGPILHRGLETRFNHSDHGSVPSSAIRGGCQSRWVGSSPSIQRL